MQLYSALGDYSKLIILQLNWNDSIVFKKRFSLVYQNIERKKTHENGKLHTYLNLFRSDKSSKIKSNVVENRMYFPTSETPIPANATDKLYLKNLVKKIKPQVQQVS